MRNLLGRLHSRRLPELLRIADTWGVPLHSESKGEVVAALYRALTDPRTVRDIWDRLAPEERAIALALADAAVAASAPTLAELAQTLNEPEEQVRETALWLYRAGILAREGDDGPLPVGVAPRLLMPRELALQLRRIQDEMAAGDAARAPLRVLIELLDDAELEGAARTWGMRTLPAVAQRQELAPRLLRLVNDTGRVQRVVQARSRDAAAIWRIVRNAPTPVALSDAAVEAGLGGLDKATVARLRAALAELEGSLLVWHAYRTDGTRWLFVPQEIREPGEQEPTALPPLEEVQLDASETPAWRSPDALAWDLLTLLRIISSPRAPVLVATDPAPRWLGRAAAPRLWFGSREGVPTGYLELLQALGRAEGVLAVDEEARPPRIVTGPQARAWRGLSFAEQTDRLREHWLRLPRWVEGEPAGIVEVWGADWRGMRPRLLAALIDEQIGLKTGEWVTLESLAARIAARFPALLGPSFMAATARLAGEAGAGGDEREARAAALGDVIAFELAGPFVWFSLTNTHDRTGQSRAICMTEAGAARAAQWPAVPEEGAETTRAPIVISPGGEITLQAPSPTRVWALSAFTEPVDLGRESHYRLTAESMGAALAAGIEREQIVTFLERHSGQALPPELTERLATWARAHQRVGLRRAIVLTLDDPAERKGLLDALRLRGWMAEPHGAEALLVTLGTGDAPLEKDEEHLLSALREAGCTPRWLTTSGDGGIEMAREQVTTTVPGR